VGGGRKRLGRKEGRKEGRKDQPVRVAYPSPVSRHLADFTLPISSSLSSKLCSPVSLFKCEGGLVSNDKLRALGTFKLMSMGVALCLLVGDRFLFVWVLAAMMDQTTCQCAAHGPVLSCPVLSCRGFSSPGPPCMINASVLRISCSRRLSPLPSPSLLSRLAWPPDENVLFIYNSFHLKFTSFATGRYSLLEDRHRHRPPTPHLAAQYGMRGRS
jgi:hypothetical protein